MTFNEIAAKILSIKEGESLDHWHNAQMDKESDDKRDIRLFMGNPERIVYFTDMHEQAIRMLIRETNKGTKYITAYVKPGKDGYYYSLEPLPDMMENSEYKEYQPALVPEEDIK